MGHGCESYAVDKLLAEGTESMAIQSTNVFGRTRNMKINLN